MAVLFAWVPPFATRHWGVLCSLVGSLFLIAGIFLLGRLLLGGDAPVGRSVAFNCRGTAPDWFRAGALVVAFSPGLAGVLTLVGLLFIKGSSLIDKTPSFAIASRWLPTVSALVAALLGCVITWNVVAMLAWG